MNRRNFLRFSAAAAGALVLDSCAHLTSRYQKPAKIAGRDDKLLLKNVSLIDVRKGRTLRSRSLLIYQGRIAEVLSSYHRPSVKPDRTIDMKGAYALPGLINAHAHINLPGGYGTGPSFLSALKRQAERNAEECVKHGITTLRDMLSPMNWMTHLKEKIARGTIAGPRIIACCALQVDGGYLRQLGILSRDRYWIDVNTPSEGTDAVKRAADLGADCIKLFQQPVELYLPGKKIPVMDQKSMTAISDEAGKQGKRIALHHVTIKGMEKGLKAGVTTLDHLASDHELTDDEMKRIIESKTHIVPTLSVAYSMCFEKKGDTNWGKGRIPDILKYRQQFMKQNLNDFLEPEIYNSSWSAFQKYSNPASFEKHHLFYWLDPTIPNAAAVMGDLNLGKLHKAGARFGCGNDGGVPFVQPGNLALEMYLMERAGFSPAEVLRSATLNNARILGMEDRIGTLEKEKFADIVILKKNPLKTTLNLRRPDMVFQNGELTFTSGETPV